MRVLAVKDKGVNELADCFHLITMRYFRLQRHKNAVDKNQKTLRLEIYKRCRFLQWYHYVGVLGTLPHDIGSASERISWKVTE